MITVFIIIGAVLIGVPLGLGIFLKKLLSLDKPRKKKQ